MNEVLEATMTSKGQVTLPIALRQQLGIEPGMKLRFEVSEHGFTFLVRPQLPMRRYYGMLKKYNLDIKDLEIPKEPDRELP
jgi:bifunctional DNA-binding transcriptional regulator/antitoxin component of YhaV-PrlF toxin-antitoxin module